MIPSISKGFSTIFPMRNFSVFPRGQNLCERCGLNDLALLRSQSWEMLLMDTYKGDVGDLKTHTWVVV